MIFLLILHFIGFKKITFLLQKLQKNYCGSYALGGECLSKHPAVLLAVADLHRSKRSSAWGPPYSRGPQIYKKK